MSYMDKVLQFVEDHPEVTRKGSVSSVTVAHDRDCGMLAGTRECTCDPDIYVITKEGGCPETLPAG